MPDNNIFSGIPALDDTAGLEQFVNNNTLNDMGLGNPSIPAALQTQPAQPAQVSQETPAQTTQTTQTTSPQYTADQVAQIIERNRMLEQQMAQARVQPQQPMASTTQYTPRQVEIIKQLIDRGVPISRIQQALEGDARRANTQNYAMQRIQNIEQYIQEQQYVAAQNEFITKMTTFGDKFGLSEDDLVTFGNVAMSKGINLTTVSDVEAVFRAIYPEQYAIRSQRIAGAPSSQIYGGANTPEAPRATTSKLEDAYVDNFLRQSMPNLYNKYPKQ